LFARLSLF